ncbi:MAG: YggT family protein [Acidobacteriota bacterium]|nr:YggT family protein [Acidobacteriota bacterium]
MIDNKLAQDEAQRAANYEAIKTDVKAEVGGEIAAEAQQPTTTETQRIDNIAGNMRQKAVDEVVDTEREVERGRFFARISQIVDYIFFVIYGLLAIRLLLALFAANNSAGFVQLIKNITDPFYAPFKGIVPSLSAEGGFTLALPIIVAIVVYMLVHLAINGLLRIFVHRKTTV